MISLSIIFSFRNEEQCLPELIHRTRTALQSDERVVSYEMVFVNDDSTDQSLKILQNELQKCQDIKIVNMSRRFGVAPCVMAGLQYSTGDAVIYMDADLQDPPEVIPYLLDAWFEDPKLDIVHTVRRSRKGETWGKMFITRIGYMILNRCTTVNLPVEAGDFKLLSRRAVNHMLNLKENNPFIRGMVCWVGFKQTFVPYDRDSRTKGKTKFPIFSLDVINNFFESALISFSSLPLRFASLVGFLSIIISFLLLGHVLLEKIQGRAIPGWTAIMIAIIFIGSIQLFCTGIIAMYLSAIHEQSRKRPTYIVESIVGFTNETRDTSEQKETQPIYTRSS